MYSKIIEFIKELYPRQNPVPLHSPVFIGNEKKYLSDCIDSTYVSYVGKYVQLFEELTAKYTGAKYAVAVVNGTAALQTALKIAGVEYGDEVITQPLTFVATANAISHCGAQPVFVDVDLNTLGMSPEKLSEWIDKNIKYDSIGKKAYNRMTMKRVAAIVPMHTFGHPCIIDELAKIANKYNIPLIEDAAESLGSFYFGGSGKNKKHTGTFGLAGILSFNGNKTITTGGGGMILTDDEEFSLKARHITTTGKIPHAWEYIHDEIAFNYRMPNVNAAIGFAQIEKIDEYIENKRNTAKSYFNFFSDSEIKFITEPRNSRSNYWLNSILLKDLNERNKFLELSNLGGVTTRPIWRLINKLDMYRNCQTGNLENASWLEERVINIPSSYRNV